MGKNLTIREGLLTGMWSWARLPLIYCFVLSRLSSEVNWSSNQKCGIWFYDKTLCEDVMLVDDVQLQNMFEMYERIKMSKRGGELG